jgi:hypothetical protein
MYFVRMSGLRPEDSVLGGGDADQVSVSLRVLGDDLNPNEVTRLLQLEPTFAASKGQTRQSGGRDVIQPTGIWMIAFSGAPQEWTLEDAVEALFDRLPSDPAVWRTMREKWSLDLFCGITLADVNRGITIRRSVLRRIAERELDLDLDIYCLMPRED